MHPRTPSDDVQATGTIPAVDDVVPQAPSGSERPRWVDEARSEVSEPGRYLAYEYDGRNIVVPVDREWTRIGRSLSADVRFDDATVSRRHALLVCQPDGPRVLDDRSLNGVYVNSRRVEWSPLSDGDRISVGRHTLWFLDTSAVPRAAAVPAGEANGP